MSVQCVCHVCVHCGPAGQVHLTTDLLHDSGDVYLANPDSAGKVTLKK